MYLHHIQNWIIFMYDDATWIVLLTDMFAVFNISDSTSQQPNNEPFPGEITNCSHDERLVYLWMFDRKDSEAERMPRKTWAKDAAEHWSMMSRNHKSHWCPPLPIDITSPSLDARLRTLYRAHFRRVSLMDTLCAHIRFLTGRSAWQHGLCQICCAQQAVPQSR